MLILFRVEKLHRAKQSIRMLFEKLMLEMCDRNFARLDFSSSFFVVVVE